MEEEEQVFLHPRNPWKRVDAIKSSRHVEVFINDQKVADCSDPIIVYETGMVDRYYLPEKDVSMEHMTKDDKSTVCPYKGTASYWNVSVGDQTANQVAWQYCSTIPEMTKIKDHICFYNEKVQIKVDGVKLPKPINWQ
eukprot:CAMPEP_0168531180 /NCGR_PEP_ID=MMETSP0405-20121227/15239_1 /TAXON_ID=498012 /ORGANISM="Trichosphaerium sp, Strain Am-I-7 wt" /LENGTH=137 /DNA_ID=CAMNT_0008555823 /DNA_START=450 /DNA_END=863 /DNA_ORIENTATION=-